MLLVNKNMPAEAFRVLESAATRILNLRSGQMGEGCSVSFEIDATLSDERYIIISEENRCALRAADGLALFAAFGRFLRLSRFDGKGGFVPFVGELDFTPKKKLRGMYFATHFDNFYHSAPIEKVYEVIEDLALRGCNSLLVWFDMHHYGSMRDESAQIMVKRLRDILAYANGIGIGGSLTMLSNEGFASSPAELRAEWAVQNGYHATPDSHYHVEICPSKKGGVEEIIRERREMLECFADLKIDYVVYWPYDQGGCTCSECAPWGANGFLKLLPHFKALINEMMPKTKVIVSAWYFDRFTDGEWEGFTERLGDEVFADVPYVLSFFANGELPPVLRDKGMPEGVEFIEFPEISMWGLIPWGGFGAAIRGAAREEAEAKERGEVLPYSVKSIREKIYARLPELIDKTIEKLAKFRKPDGSFSYEQHRSSPTTQGVPVSLGENEGDVNGLACAMHYTLSGIFGVLGIKLIPQCSNEDFLRFREKIEAAHKNAK